MATGDWSSDVCSSDLLGMMGESVDGIVDPVTMESKYPEEWDFDRIYDEIGRASCRERV